MKSKPLKNSNFHHVSKEAAIEVDIFAKACREGGSRDCEWHHVMKNSCDPCILWYHPRVLPRGLDTVLGWL